MPHPFLFVWRVVYMLTPKTRKEQILNAFVQSDKELLPVPKTRKEIFLSAILDDSINKPTPITREEMYLDAIELSGEGTGGSGGLYENVMPVYDVSGYPGITNSVAVDAVARGIKAGARTFCVVLIQGFSYIFYTLGTYFDLDNGVITSDGDMYSWSYSDTHRARGTSVDFSSYMPVSILDVKKVNITFSI